MSILESLLKDVQIPKMVKVRQKFPTEKIEDVGSATIEQLSRPEIAATIKEGMRICLTCSSRGVDNLALVLCSAATFVKSRGAQPFIIPAMGSHGGATAEGQLEICRCANVTEEYCGCPIVSCMDTVKIGTCEDGIDVYIDKHAAESDGIIVIGRVKPHTAFTGDFESGIMKMMAIGMGKQYGASVCHNRGFGAMAHMVPMFGRTILKNAPVIAALALVENSHERTCIIKGLTPEEIALEEPKLLKKAKALMPRILFDSCDLLIVDYIGKNISGAGMDPNITGRFDTPYKTGGIKAQRLVVLDITDESHGNACGVGLADVCSKRVLDKMDFEMTYANCITSKLFVGGYLAPVMPNDKLTVQCAIKTCVDIDTAAFRVIRIRDTSSLDTIEISEALLDEARGNPDIEILSEPYELTFDEQGALEGLV